MSRENVELVRRGLRTLRTARHRGGPWTRHRRLRASPARQLSGRTGDLLRPRRPTALARDDPGCVGRMALRCGAPHRRGRTGCGPSANSGRGRRQRSTCRPRSSSRVVRPRWEGLDGMRAPGSHRGPRSHRALGAGRSLTNDQFPDSRSWRRHHRSRDERQRTAVPLDTQRSHSRIRRRARPAQSVPSP
jgi:hypothetical protein